MAHVGVVYPVIFRRDFNLNVFANWVGWSKYYIFFFRFLPSGDANTLDNFQFTLGPETYPDSKSITWISPYYAVPVFQFKVEILVQINDGKTYTKTGGLFSKTGGLIFSWTWSVANDEHRPNFPFNQPVTVTYWNPEWFDYKPSGTLLICQPWEWVDGAPHP